MKQMLVGLVLLGVYVVATRQREGFETGKTPTDVLKELKTMTDTKYGNLNLSVYKKDYQDIVAELDRNTDLAMLEMIATKDVSTPTNRMYFNHASEFKKNLSEFKSILGNLS
jgi:hypothetical protein